jgi:hypothetical protein
MLTIHHEITSSGISIPLSGIASSLVVTQSVNSDMKDQGAELENNIKSLRRLVKSLTNKM